jgi:glycosyltransferase involved in cell wall biosynthesis
VLEATFVIIPAFNEARNIEATLAATLAVVPPSSVVVVDDGSGDDTASRVAALGLHVVRHPFNLGYGVALQTGYKYAQRHDARYLVQLDADGQHDPADIPRLLAPLSANQADLVLASRFLEPSGYAMPAFRAFGRNTFRALLASLGGPRVADPTSGYQAMARNVIDFYCNEFFPVDYPDADVLLLLHRCGFRITEVPVRMAPSPRPSMHDGPVVLYYIYKMLVSLLRSASLRRSPGSRTHADST